MFNFNNSTLEIVIYFGLKSNNETDTFYFNKSMLEIVFLFWMEK